MGTNLTFQYDREADILYINTCAPYPEQESEELDDEVIARFNPETNEIENLEILFFQRDYYARNFFNYRSPLVCIWTKHKSMRRATHTTKHTGKIFAACRDRDS